MTGDAGKSDSTADHVSPAYRLSGQLSLFPLGIILHTSSEEMTGPEPTMMPTTTVMTETIAPRRTKPMIATNPLTETMPLTKMSRTMMTVMVTTMTTDRSEGTLRHCYRD